MDIKTVAIEKPADVNVIVGQSHFIKTVEDIHETAVSSVPGIKFGLAFCEASGECLIRWSGNDDEMIELAKRNAGAIAAGHTFVLFMREAFPINLLNAVKNVPEVCTIFCATANAAQVVIAETRHTAAAGLAPRSYAACPFTATSRAQGHPHERGSVRP